jgi:hypothetical protein
MAMKRNRFVAVGLVLLLCAPLAAQPQKPDKAEDVNRSWEKLVETLRPGETVEVTWMTGKKANGKVLSLALESITVEGGDVARDPTREETISRNDVFRVRICGSRRLHALLGMVIGAVGGGAGLGAKYKSPGQKGEYGVGFGVFVGAVLGGGAGLAVGAALPPTPPLYEASSDFRMAWLKEHAPTKSPATNPSPAKR